MTQESNPETGRQTRRASAKRTPRKKASPQNGADTSAPDTHKGKAAPSAKTTATAPLDDEAKAKVNTLAAKAAKPTTADAKKAALKETVQRARRTPRASTKPAAEAQPKAAAEQNEQPANEASTAQSKSKNERPESESREAPSVQEGLLKAWQEAADLLSLRGRGKSDYGQSVSEDPEKLAEYLADVAKAGQGVIEDFVNNQAEQARRPRSYPFDPLNVGEAFLEIFKGMTKDPAKAYEAHLELWRGYMRLWEHVARRMLGEPVEPVAKPAPGDKRFRHKAWEESHILDLLKQSYLIAAQWTQSTVADLGGMDEREKRRVEFYTKQFVDAFSPSNFALTNPEVIEATLESRGENLLRGLKNLLEDLDHGDGQLSIRQVDREFFKVGDNVASSKGQVVFQNDIMQLIQYEPQTEKVHKRPLLIFPPWINKFYILDLRPDNSFVRWATEQGRTVFLVSWVNPDGSLADKTFDDYIKEGCFAALDAVKGAIGEEEVDAVGYCVGGTMLATALAYMGQKGDNRIKSATFFTAQTDFAEAGDLAVFVDERQLENLDRQIQDAGGFLEGQAMANTFNMLRANDLIWSFVIDNYLIGKEPKRFDLLYWNSDSTRVPRAVHLFYLREYYLHNRLTKGELEVLGECVDLKDVKIPVYFAATETDHIAPYRSVYRGLVNFGGPVRFILAGSGHIAGVVNPPAAQKYHFSTNDALPGKVEEWLEGSEQFPGSWWTDWIKWMDAMPDKMVPARDPSAGGLKPIEPAPGSYVKVSHLE